MNNKEQLYRQSFEYLIYTELEEGPHELFRWTNGKLQEAETTEGELAAWQALASTLPTHTVPSLMRTPAGESWSLKRYASGVGLWLVTAPPHTGLLPADMTFAMELLGQLALASLEVKWLQRQLHAQQALQKQFLRQALWEARSDFVQSVCHKFNNLLGVFLLNAELGAQEPDEATAQKVWTRIQQAAWEGAHFLRRFLPLERQPNGVPEDLELVDLGEIVHIQACEIWEKMALPPGGPLQRYELRLQCVPDLHVFLCPRQLHEVLWQLLANAREAMSDGGPVLIEVKRSHPQACLCVHDAGTGMLPEQMKQALQPYFSTKGPQHLGLGLSLVRSIVEQWRGELVLDHSPLGGLAVTIKLPLSNIHRLRAQRQQWLPTQTTVPEAEPLKILLAEDDPCMRQALLAALEKSGHSVWTAEDGRRAIEQLRYLDSFDVLLLDLVLPEKNGWEVAAVARQLQPQAAIVVLTGWSVNLELPEAQRVDAVLTKPISLEKLQSTLMQAVAQRRTAMAPQSSSFSSVETS